MSFWNKFPYTDFHELNLDWIIKRIKELTEKVNNFDKNFKDIIYQWLNEHPEATTTVQDGSITPIKMHSSFWDYLKSLFKSNSIDFDVIFPKMTYAGTCVFIKSENHVIMVDSGYVSSYEEIVSQMAQNGITHIDTVIISHYHNDHITNIPLFCANGYIDENTTAYYPVSPVWESMIDNDSYYNEIKARIINTNNAITSTGANLIEVNTENTVVNAGDFSIKFNNCSLLTYANYYNDVINNGDLSDYNHTNYNNFSMCATIYSGNKSVFCSGDVEYLAQETIAQYIDRNFDIYVLPHHDTDVKASNKFNTKVHAKYAVQTGSHVVSPKANGNMVITTGTIYSLENENDTYRKFTVKDDNITSNVYNRNYLQSPFNMPAKTIVPGDDLNNYTTPGTYYSKPYSEGTITNEPPVNKTYRLEVKQINRIESGRCMQDLITRDGVHYRRYKTSIGDGVGWIAWRLVSDAVRSVSVGNRLTVQPLEGFIRSGNIYVYGDNEHAYLSFRTVKFDIEVSVNTVFATIPEALRPSMTRYLPFSCGGELYGTILINTNGEVSFSHLSQNVTPDNYFYLDLPYYTGMTSFSNVD